MLPSTLTVVRSMFGVIYLRVDTISVDQNVHHHKPMEVELSDKFDRKDICYSNSVGTK